MLILERVKQKKQCRGLKWGGLLPISNLRSQHCNSVATGGTMACIAGALARTTEVAHVRASIPRKACRYRPP